MGNPSSAVTVRMPCPVPLAAGGSFTDGRFHIPHALWVKKSLHHSVLAQVLSCQSAPGLSQHPSPDLACGGLLATLLGRLCLLRALDSSTPTRTNANTYFFLRFFFPYECGKCKIYSMISFVCVFVHKYSFTHSFANIMGSGFLLFFYS